MTIERIDGNWAQQSFPEVFHVFGSPLLRQINAFNEILDDRGTTEEADLDIVFARLTRELADPHKPLLNTLSLYSTDRCPPELKAMLSLLEIYLKESLAGGCTVNTYRTMLRSSGSYLDLIAELDWVCRLRASGGVVDPHAATNPAKPAEGNYDLCWHAEGQTLHGDIKWFKDWLVKPRGQDLLSGFIKLFQTDVRHTLIVLVRMRQWTIDSVINAAHEAIALYHAAIAGTRDSRWVLGKTKTRIDLRLRAAYAFPPLEGLLVEGVSVFIESEFEPGQGKIQVIETGAGGEDDFEAVRRNLGKAATQIPCAPQADDVCCVFIGSAVKADEEDVRRVLHSVHPEGHPARVPGLFDEDSPVPGYEHLHGVVHFTLNFGREVDGNRVAISRTAKLFEGPAAMNAAQRALIEKAIGVVVQDTVWQNNSSDCS